MQRHDQQRHQHERPVVPHHAQPWVRLRRRLPLLAGRFCHCARRFWPSSNAGTTRIARPPPAISRLVTIEVCWSSQPPTAVAPPGSRRTFERLHRRASATARPAPRLRCAGGERASRPEKRASRTNPVRAPAAPADASAHRRFGQAAGRSRSCQLVGRARDPPAASIPRRGQGRSQPAPRPKRLHRDLPVEHQDAVLALSTATSKLVPLMPRLKRGVRSCDRASGRCSTSIRRRP